MPNSELLSLLKGVDAVPLTETEWMGAYKQQILNTNILSKFKAIILWEGS